MSTVTGERRAVYPGIDQVAVRGAVVLGALTSVVAAQAAGARPHLWQQLLLCGLALLLALRPESSAGAVLMVGLALLWSSVTAPMSPLVLLAAAGMVLTHVAAVVAAEGPATMAIDGEQVRRQLWRGTLLWLAAAAIWGLDLAAADLRGGRLAYAVGLAVVLVIAVAATRLVSQRR